MAVIELNKLESYLKAVQKKGNPHQVYLVHGEEMLHKKALTDLLSTLEKGNGVNADIEVFENDVDEMGEIVEHLNTFSLLSGPKIIALKDSRLFYTRKDKTDLMQKVKEAHGAGNLPRAARFMARIMGLLQMGPEDFEALSDKNRSDELPVSESWFRAALQYCMENNITASTNLDAQTVLLEALSKGIPEGNFLLIATEHVNRGHRLYKKIVEIGSVIDCSVPMGSRAADQRVQENVMREQLDSVLGPVEKGISPEAYKLLQEMTGFELRTFVNNLEKLVDYTGDRKRIESEDVRAVLQRSKKDPIYEFTNAVTERDAETALFYLQSLLSGGEIDHPLQLLAAILKQMRMLLLAKDFTESPDGAAWQLNMTFNQFRNYVLPALEDYDRLLFEKVSSWKSQLAVEEASGRKRSGKKSADTDLRLLKNPRSPYPTFLTLKKSGLFSRSELIAILAEIGNVDYLLKSSGGEGRMILQRLILMICNPTELEKKGR